MTKDILRLPLMVDPTLMHGQESGKALAALDLAKQYLKPPNFGIIPCLDYLVRRNQIIAESVTNNIGRYGSSYRPDSLADIYVHYVLASEMAKDAWKHVENHVDVAYQIAKECLDNKIFDKSGRITHGSIGNPLYLNAYLVPAGFIAWGISWRKAVTIFHAALLTKSRSFFLAMGAGVLVYTVRGLRPPLFALAIPLVLPVLLFKSFSRIIRFRNRQDSARLGFRRVIKAAKRDGKVYGYGNFADAVEEYFEEYTGKNPNGQLLSESWADRSHSEWAEWDVTLGEEKAKELRSIYWGWLKKSQKPWLAGAWAAHLACLSVSFRTEAASIQEDFLIALVDHGTYLHGSNHFKAYYDAHKAELEAREYKWKANLAIYLALSEGTEEQKLEALKIRPLTIEGPLKVPNKVSPEVAGAIKQAYEWDIEHHPSAERVYRYWWLLKYFQDPDAVQWEAKLREMSPKRSEAMIRIHPRNL